MLNGKSLLLVYIIGILAAFQMGCGDNDSGSDGKDTGGDTDTDTDSDTDSDSDSDECNPPVGVTDWGSPCTPSGNDCSEDTHCVYLSEIGGDLGYCSPLCCEGDDSYCTDIGSGNELCLIANDQTGEWKCMIICTVSEDCVDGTVCQEVPNSSISVCYPGTGDTDVDTGTDTGSDSDS